MASAVSTGLPRPTSGSNSPGVLLARDPTDQSQITNSANSAAGSLINQGNALTGAGAAGLAPLMQRLMKLLSGNSNAVDEATKPQVTSVLRQYDTARRNSAQFAPRGGGSTSANLQSRTQEASDISNVKSQAVTDAGTQLQGLVTQLLGIGGQEQAAGSNDLVSLVQTALQGKAQTAAEWSAIGQGVGTIAMLALLL
jgi:hypothetical protein